MVNSRIIGWQSVQQCIKYYESEGYLIDNVEKTGRFRKYKDLYSKWFKDKGLDGGFDQMAIHEYKNPVLIQVTTTKPKVHIPYKLFAKEFPTVAIHQFVRIKGRGKNLVVIYDTNGKKYVKRFV